MSGDCTNCSASDVHIRKGYCGRCYRQYRETGDPNKHKPYLCETPAVLTERQVSVLNGHMLGDGSLDRGKTKGSGKIHTDRIPNTSLAIMRQARDAEYLAWSVNVFGNLFGQSPLPLRVKDKFDKRTHKNYSYVAFGTRNLTVLNEHKSIWYNELGVKIVPQDLKLDSLMIAVWFCDDGWIRTNDKAEIGIGFATNGFSEAEVRFLAQQLEDRYGADFVVYQFLSNGKKQYTIRVSTSGSTRIIRDIEPVFPDGMLRKKIWTEELLQRCESSKKVYSYAQSSKDRHAKVIKYLQTHNEFGLIQMGLDLNWTFSRANGDIGVPTSNIYKYIASYVDGGYIAKIDRRANGYRNGDKYVITDSGRKHFDSL